MLLNCGVGEANPGRKSSVEGTTWVAEAGKDRVRAGRAAEEGGATSGRNCWRAGGLPPALGIRGKT